MSTLDDIINSTENLEIKRALAIKMFFSDFKVEDICKLLNVSDSFVSKWKMIYENKGASALKVKYQGGTPTCPPAPWPSSLPGKRPAARPRKSTTCS